MDLLAAYHRDIPAPLAYPRHRALRNALFLNPRIEIGVFVVLGLLLCATFGSSFAATRSTATISSPEKNIPVIPVSIPTPITTTYIEGRDAATATATPDTTTKEAVPAYDITPSAPTTSSQHFIIFTAP